ncbi:ly6/PLAUR domain-containing protein 2-like [Hemicordylus capensis]|uniref:ly6/PLAUR domain-containing protein 2-like n=1 Tax=Hemicordylus capensis TaxID=884348 RepID=UPI002302615C|nr:ly6/PLAUR domain-containing protein 2-like [Hemicordylus capensis]
MKAVLAALLTFVASLELALALMCYTCNQPTDLSNCWTRTNCSLQTVACKTTVHSVDSGFPFFGNITVTKSCAEKCTPSEPDGIGESHPDFCCYNDLCNVGSGQEARVTFSAMGFTAAIAFALLWTRV